MPDPPAVGSRSSEFKLQPCRLGKSPNLTPTGYTATASISVKHTSNRIIFLPNPITSPPTARQSRTPARAASSVRPCALPCCPRADGAQTPRGGCCTPRTAAQAVRPARLPRPNLVPPALPLLWSLPQVSDTAPNSSPRGWRRRARPGPGRAPGPAWVAVPRVPLLCIPTVSSQVKGVSFHPAKPQGAPEVLRPGQQAWEAGRRDTGPGGSLAAEAVRGGCGLGLWQRGVRGEAGGRREGSLLEGTGTAPAGAGKGCETLQMTSQGQSHTTSTFQGVWWKVRLALGVHVRVLHAGQRLAIPAPAADAPCSPIVPRKMPRACIPKWPAGGLAASLYSSSFTFNS